MNLFNAAAAGLPADPAAAALAPTPTRNLTLPFRRGGFASLPESAARENFVAGAYAAAA